MGWRDSYRTASFRGVQFHVESAESSHGRRQAVHEHAQRDVPYTEDLGRKAREFTISGYVIGADYHLARDALVEACEQAGPGQLVHPYKGELTVVCRGLNISESSDNGGMCRLSLTFLESGEASFPSATTDSVNAIGGASNSLIAAAKDSFLERFGVAGFAEYVAEAARDGLAAVGDFIASPGFNLQAELAAASDLYYSARDMAAEAFDLIQAPLGMANRMLGVFGGIRSGFGVGSFGVLGSLFSSFGSLFAGKVNTPGRRQMAANHYAINDFTRQVAIAEIARETSVRLYEAQSSPVERASATTRPARGAPFGLSPSLRDVVAARDQVLGMIDSELEADRTSDDVFLALTALRAEVVRGIPGQNSALPRTAIYTPRTTLPALVVAHQLYGDASRSDEIAIRNNASHPGFIVGGQALEVLTDAG